MVNTRFGKTMRSDERKFGVLGSFLPHSFPCVLFEDGIAAPYGTMGVIPDGMLSFFEGVVWATNI
jgi:hypothetical protein